MTKCSKCDTELDERCGGDHDQPYRPDADIVCIGGKSHRHNNNLCMAGVVDIVKAV